MDRRIIRAAYARLVDNAISELKQKWEIGTVQNGLYAQAAALYDPSILTRDVGDLPGFIHGEIAQRELGRIGFELQTR